VSPTPTNKILILDFGSQYTQLIARRVRECNVYSEIMPFSTPLAAIRSFAPAGIILSGGPASVYASDAPQCHPELFDLSIPVLGICYGMQLMAHLLGGSVTRSSQREYGHAELIIDDPVSLLSGLSNRTSVWMSHGDRIRKIPPGFKIIAHTDHSPAAAMHDPRRRLYALQFHPEVAHTHGGMRLLQTFLSQICGCKQTWEMGSFLKKMELTIANQIGDGRGICAVSGGVDSSVAAVMVQRVIGKRLTCILVDNGLLRKNEAKEVAVLFKKRLGLNLKVVHAEDRFLSRLQNVSDPERKRKIIGREFISVFEEHARRIGQIDFLVQGTLYPDVIESVSYKGPSATIKTHHNVGGLPKRMRLQLVEPLRLLFKDEVRRLGLELGIPKELLDRHPFPGPGLAVRLLGKITPDRLSRLREADAIFEEEIRKAGLYQVIWQAFAVDLPIRTVGVMGDERTYQNVISLRAVMSVDGMTADWAPIPDDVLRTVSRRIINEVSGINRVVYDISSKPPSTIEWE